MNEDTDIDLELPEHLMKAIIRIHHEMNDHIKGGGQTPEQTFIRLLAIGVEEWDAEKDR